jgi:hypothetical protein
VNGVSDFAQTHPHAPIRTDTASGHCRRATLKIVVPPAFLCCPVARCHPIASRTVPLEIGGKVEPHTNSMYV